MTQEQKRRVIEALAETESVLEKARSYSEQFQDKELIAKYEAHKAKLLAMMGL